WLAGLRRWGLDFPNGRVDTNLNRLLHYELLAKLCLEGLPPGILPAGIDDQCVLAPFFQHRAEFLSRAEAALDPAGMNEQRQARAAAIPQLLAQLQKSHLDGLTVFQQQLQVLIRFP